jgi:hypothetical protein
MKKINEFLIEATLNGTLNWRLSGGKLKSSFSGFDYEIKPSMVSEGFRMSANGFDMGFIYVSLVEAALESAAVIPTSKKVEI